MLQLITWVTTKSRIILVQIPKTLDGFSFLETLLKKYIVRNEAGVQSQVVFLRNLKNEMGQLIATLSSKPQVIQRT